MAFGFPARHREDIDIVVPGVPALDVAVGACERLGWSVASRTDNELEARVGANLLSWGERLIVREVSPGSLSIESRCRLPTQCLDWGKNKKNVVEYLRELRDVAEFERQLRP